MSGMELNSKINEKEISQGKMAVQKERRNTKNSDKNEEEKKIED